MHRLHRRLEGLGLFLSLLCSVVAQAQHFDATAQFSVTSGNPNGVWSYGWMPVGFGAFSLYTNHAVTAGPIWYGWGGDLTPSIWVNDGAAAFGVPTGSMSLHPGNGTEPTVLRFTAPAGGAAHIYGAFQPGDGGVMQVAVRYADQDWWHATDSGSFDLQTNVTTGTTIDFTVYGSYLFGNTPLHATVDLVPGEFSLIVARVAATNVVSFPAQDGSTYVLQYTPTLTPPVLWSEIGTYTALSNGGFSFMDPRSNTSGFYRVRKAP